jgi:hypothetical protein
MTKCRFTSLTGIFANPERLFAQSRTGPTLPMPPATGHP